MTIQGLEAKQERLLEPVRSLAGSCAVEPTPYALWHGLKPSSVRFGRQARSRTKGMGALCITVVEAM